MYFSVLTGAIIGFVLMVTPVNQSTDEEILNETIDQKELLCLTDAIYYEANNQDLKGMQAIADVIQNRTNSNLFKGRTFCEIIHERKQFSFLDGNHFNNQELKVKSQETKEYKVAQDIAFAVLLGEHTPVLEGDVLWYHADYVQPIWSKFMKKVQVIKNHVFYARINSLNKE
jgi:spore germination cell wall hydrolase CwlJ-like protein